MAQLDLANLADAQVYCGTWAKYNAGSLFGKWMRLADYSDYEDFINACRELHKDEEDPEFDLQDDVYRGHFDSPAEFAEYEAGELEIPEHLTWLFAHIDWEGVWYSNTKYEYDEHDGYYFYSR